MTRPTKVYTKPRVRSPEQFEAEQAAKWSRFLRPLRWALLVALGLGVAAGVIVGLVRYYG